MKTQVFVLVPYDVATVDIDVFERLLLEKPDEPGRRGRYDYLVGALDFLLARRSKHR